jgi:hypothetical protein
MSEVKNFGIFASWLVNTRWNLDSLTDIVR